MDQAQRRSAKHHRSVIQTGLLSISVKHVKHYNQNNLDEPIQVSHFAICYRKISERDA